MVVGPPDREAGHPLAGVGVVAAADRPTKLEQMTRMPEDLDLTSSASAMTESDEAMNSQPPLMAAVGRTLTASGIGNGWVGGLLPATAFAMVASTGDIYYGLWYPIVFATVTFVVGLIFIPETKDRDIFAGD